MRYRTILFDLDGTLTDPAEGITKSVAYALGHFGIEVENLTTLHPFIGPPLKVSFQRHYNFDDESAFQAIRLYRERFSTIGWRENVPYDGIREMLQALVAGGKRLMVATSKPEHFAKQILKHFALAEYFEVICGAPMDEKVHSTKTTVIADALNRGNVTDLTDVVMVGDREHDVIGAHENGIAAIGVLYGYGNRQEHEGCGAEFIVETVENLQNLLLA